MKQFLHIKLLLLLVVLLSGCSTDRARPTPSVMANTVDPDKTFKDAVLAMSEGVKKSLRAMAEIKNAQMKSSISQESMARLEWENNIIPPNLGTQVSMDWNGTPEQPLQMISDYTGYKFVSSDQKPNIKPVVMIHSNSRPAIDILRDIGNQLGKVAKVRILASSKTIKLIYTADNSGQ